MLTTVKGLIIRETQYSESDKFLTVLTSRLGKISVMGKGIRSVRSRFMTSTQLFCYSEMVVYKKADKYWLKEASLIDSFYNIRNNIENFTLGQYFLDIANEVCVEGENEDDMLRLLLNSLFALTRDTDNLSLIKGAFELRTCANIGLMPDLVACNKCATYESSIMYFDIMNGNIKCEKCFHDPGTDMSAHTDGTLSIIMHISPSVLAAMRYVIYTNPERLFSFNLSGSSLEEFSLTCERYLINHLEKSFVTLDFYKDITKMGKG